MLASKLDHSSFAEIGWWDHVFASNREFLTTTRILSLPFVLGMAQKHSVFAEQIELSSKEKRKFDFFEVQFRRDFGVFSAEGQATDFSQ